jgi:hypothetical protein
MSYFSPEEGKAIDTGKVHLKRAIFPSIYFLQETKMVRATKQFLEVRETR